MRVVFDALGAPGRSGGMRLYAEELMRAWREVAPLDDMVVLGGPWVRSVLAPLGIRTVVVSERVPWRIAAQWLLSPVIARWFRADLVLSVSLVVSPLAGRPRMCVVHDWRHIEHPEEFSWVQRAYRKTWAWSVGAADTAIQISAKTDAETARIVPGSVRAIVENGQDHPRRWARHPPRPSGSRAFALTFGHQTNKRPELVISALAAMPSSDLDLIILGADGKYAQQLRSHANSLGVGQHVKFPGFVDSAEYERLVQQSSVIVLASTDEGYGLPVVEGAFFGVPVISTTDNGVNEIHGDRALYAQPLPQELAREIENALATRRTTGHQVNHGWNQTAVGIHHIAEELLERRQTERPT